VALACVIINYSVILLMMLSKRVAYTFSSLENDPKIIYELPNPMYIVIDTVLIIIIAVISMVLM
jgi:hypothetical protein